MFEKKYVFEINLVSTLPPSVRFTPILSIFNIMFSLYLLKKEMNKV